MCRKRRLEDVLLNQQVFRIVLEKMRNGECDMIICVDFLLSGVHTLQRMYGCEVDGDGTKRGYVQFGYDGEDFLSLDKSTLTWTAAKSQAMATKVKWDSTGAEANVQTNYLENTCIEWINKYVVYGRDTLERKCNYISFWVTAEHCTVNAYHNCIHIF